MSPPFGLVTGGSSGIGLAFAEALQARGCRVVVVGRDAGRLAAAQTRLAPLGPVPPETLALDVRDAAAVRVAMEGLLAKYGAPSWVVTSAGIAWPGRFLDQPLNEHEAQWRTNYLGTLHVLHALAPAMARAGRGQVILVSSAAALAGFAGYGAYAPSKWALRGL
ncbi:MAG: SDR family NAD(P)-dependent oxidoreductase, partial [Roseomonas sp.]|nr:SDR family NAD(P)-dependent oxidoreductase [Roseomonas sp.]